MSLANRVTELKGSRPITFAAFLDWLEPAEREAALAILRNPLVKHTEVAQVFAEEYPEAGNFGTSTIGSWRRANGVGL